MHGAPFPDWQVVCPELAILADETALIRAEALRVQALPGWFSHHQRADYEHDADWRIFPIYLFDRINADNVGRMPHTSALLARIPCLRAALLSYLGPQGEIRPHRGPPEISNFILRCHLGLSVPDGCAIQIHGEVRPIQEGTWLVFDDLLEHSSINPSSQGRLVLLCDIARPGPPPLPLTEPPWSERSKSWPLGWEEIGAAGRYIPVPDFAHGLATLAAV